MNKVVLGQVVATSRVARKMNENQAFNNFVRTSIGKFKNGDWGDTCEEDKAENYRALIDGERLLAEYVFKNDGTKIWIVTEWDRSKTTILFPHEY